MSVISASGKDQRVAVLVDHQGDFDSRVLRTVKALIDAGYRVRMFTIGSRSTIPTPMEAGGERQDIRMSVSRRADVRTNALRNAIKNYALKLPGTKGALLLTQLYLIYKNLKPAVIEYNPDFIHANDLNTLYAGVRLSRKCGSKLIYDAHEYEAGRHPTSDMTRILIGFRVLAEKNLANKADATLTVSDSIADLMKNKLKIDRPAVIINSSNLSSSNPRSLEVRKRLIYVGAIKSGRGLTECINSLTLLNDYNLELCGPSSPSFVQTLQMHAKEKGVFDRVSFLNPIPIDKLMIALQGAHASIVFLDRSSLSYEYALPNKIFESICAKVPIISSSNTEIAALVQYLKVGIVLQSPCAAQIATAVKEIESKRPNIECLPTEYTWNFHKDRLISVYNALRIGIKVPNFAPLPHYANIK